MGEITRISLQLVFTTIFFTILFITGYKRLSFKLTFYSILLGIILQVIFNIAELLPFSENGFIFQILDSLTLGTLPILTFVIILLIMHKIDFIKYGDRPPLPGRVMELRILLAALKVLNNELKLSQIIAVVKDLSKMKKSGEPWKGLENVTDAKDIDSRKLIGDAILMYRSLKNRIGQENAEKIVKKVIMESAIMQLYSLIPQIKKSDIEKKSRDEMGNMLTKIVDKFPNADWELMETSGDTFAYKITRCRLVELVSEIGHPELKDAFCPGDGIYFEKYQQDIIFDRPKNIGMLNDNCCDFVFKLKN